MNLHVPSIERVYARLTQTRSNPSLKKNFPKDLWEDIFLLIKEHSFDTVCKRLHLNRSLLSRKIAESASNRPNGLRFKEVTLPPLESHPMQEGQVTITISKGDIKACIEGPVSCIASIASLFKEK